MNFEDLQSAWQCQHTTAKVTINANADVLLKEVRRKQRQFRVTLFWSDVVGIGLTFLLTLVFSYHGLRHANWTPFRMPNWDFLLLAFACAGVGTFMLANRTVQHRKQTIANDPLKASIQASLNDVNHQIWLQRSVFWWYLLPLATASAVSFCYASLLAHNLKYVAFLVLFVIPLNWGIYRLNQFNVRKTLEPRRQELQTLLASLE